MESLPGCTDCTCSDEAQAVAQSTRFTLKDD
jgi:hypothetical protein